jgi:hypothetical protein
VNVNAQDAFTVGRKDEKTIEVSKETHDTFDWSLGVSETGTLDISAGGRRALRQQPKHEFTLSETFGYDYAHHKDNYNKNMDQQSLTLEVLASRDDSFHYRVQTIDVWRYYVFGVDFKDEAGNSVLGYFDITAARPGRSDT